MALKGHKTWNKGVRMWEGKEHPRGMLGKKHSYLTKEKYSEVRRGVKKSIEHKRKIAESHMGIKRSEETKKRIGETRRIRKIPSSMKGKYHSEETKQKLREARLIQKIPNKETGIELKVEKELQNRGINYQKQVPLC